MYACFVRTFFGFGFVGRGSTPRVPRSQLFGPNAITRVKHRATFCCRVPFVWFCCGGACRACFVPDPRFLLFSVFSDVLVMDARVTCSSDQAHGTYTRGGPVLTASTSSCVSGRRYSTASTASNSAPDDGGGSRRRSSIDKAKPGKARSRPSNDTTSHRRQGRGKPSSSGGPRSNTSSSTRHEGDEEPDSPLPQGTCVCVGSLPAISLDTSLNLRWWEELDGLSTKMSE